MTFAETIAALNAEVWTLRSVEPIRALALSEEAVRLARTLNNPALLAPSLCLHGVCLVIVSRHAEARAALGEALALSRPLGDHVTEGRCLHFLGVSHYFLAEHAEASRARHGGACHLSRLWDDDEWRGAGFNTLGNVQFSLCDYSGALDWYTRALEARERAGDELGVAGSLGNLGNVYSERGDLTEALHFHQRGLEHAVRIGSTVLEISSLCNLGGDYVDLGRYAEGIEVCRRSVVLGERMEDWEKVAVAFTSMGSAYVKTGQQAQALDCHRRALEIAHRHTLQKAAAHALYSIGEILLLQGTLGEARERLAESALLAHAIGARRTAFQCAEALAEVCRRQGDYAAALGHYEMFRTLEKKVFTEEAQERAQALVIQMEVAHHRRESESLAALNAALQEANTQLEEANARLEILSVTDALTNLPNHRALIAALEAQIARARREDTPCAVLFLDIDHFKQVNDTYGHPIGDAVLRQFAVRVRSCLREEDVLGRWGGEEFLILLPGTDARRAQRIGERVRAAVADRPLLERGPAFGCLSVTCSIGTVACPPHPPLRDTLIAAADTALYAAKRGGRNQVRAAGIPVGD